MYVNCNLQKSIYEVEWVSTKLFIQIHFDFNKKKTIF